MRRKTTRSLKHTRVLCPCRHGNGGRSKTRGGNDLPAIIARKQEAETFAAMIRSAVAQLSSECDRRPLVPGITLHPYIMGQAHRVPSLARVPTDLREAERSAYLVDDRR